MVNVAKNVPISGELPVLTETLQMTWQLLGLRRWLPRNALRQSAVAKTPAIHLSPGGRGVPASASQEANVSRDAPLPQTAFEAEGLAEDSSRGAEKIKAIELGAGTRLFDFPACSLLAAEKSDVLWCLPPLWEGEDGYRLFHSRDEAELLANALLYVGLETDASLFRHCAPFLGAEAPRFPADMWLCEQIAPFSQGRTVVWCGAVSLRMVMERFLGDNTKGERRMTGCLHPALALRSARGKYRLWTDLERIRGSVCMT